MKLHLHWLRFDLHRFRLILGVWTLLVAAYAVFLGWVHLRFLTVSQDILNRSLYIAILLGLLELGFLAAIFHADPARGPRHFWRTRPPSGMAVAGSKLVLALAFFVILPLLAWGVMNAFCVLQEYAVVQSSTGLSWTAFLFWIQSLTVSAFALASARSESKKDFYLHLAASTVGVVAGIWALREVGNALAPEPMDPGTERWLVNGFFTPLMAVLSLTAAVAYLILARRRRLPAGSGLGWVLLLPIGALLTAANAWRAPTVSLRDESLPPADPAMAGKIRITEWLLHERTFNEMGPYNGSLLNPFYITWPSPERIWFYLFLKVEGLPPGTRVGARWLNLHLTTPDGTVIQADTRFYPPSPSAITQQAPDMLMVYGVPFPRLRLNPYDLSRCTVSGTLRLTLYSWQDQVPPPPDGRIHSSPLGPLLVRPRRDYQTEHTMRQKIMKLLNVDFLQTDYAPLWRMSLVSDSDELPLAIYTQSNGPGRGFLIRHGRHEASVYIENTPHSALARHPDLLENVRADRPLPPNWQLKVGASSPVATMDVPVTLRDVIPWTRQGYLTAQRMETDIPRMLAGIHPHANSSADAVRSDLRYAYRLIYHIYSSLDGTSREEALSKCLPLWRDILTEVPREHLPALLEVFRDGMGRAMSMEEYNKYKNRPAFSQFHYYLGKRAAELVQLADMPAILADPDLAAKLRPFLPASAAPESGAPPRSSPSGAGDQQPDR